MLRDGLELAPGVTFLVGENGSGKSTLLEGLAGAFGLGVEGGGRASLHQTYASESELAERLRLVRGAGGTRNGFFLRAETMHGFFTYLATEAGAQGYHEMSHGESFLAAMAWYFRRPGFFCLDEPEAALSFSSTLVLVGQLHELARTGGAGASARRTPPSSPPCRAPPSSRSASGACARRPGTTSCWCANWRSYLQDPQRYLRHVLEP